MGWKGQVRSVQTAVNRAARETERQQREYARQQASLAKMAEAERAAAEVSMFNDYLNSLETIQTAEVVEVDWAGIAHAPKPDPPTRYPTHEKDAQRELDGFKPRFTESKKRQAARRELLAEAVVKGASRDTSEYEAALAKHLEDVERWQADKEHAERVLNGDIEALGEAASQIEDLAGGDRLRHLNLSFSEGSLPSLTVSVYSITEAVPDQMKTLLSSGRMSLKQMPKGRYHELYQDYVCGTSLLVATAVMGILPIRELIVTAEAEMLDGSTGHMEETPILSFLAVHDTIGRLNLDMVDPSSAMSNFTHNMRFQKTKGFAPVEPIADPRLQ